MTDPFLDIEGLTHQWGEESGIFDISLTLNRGEFIILAGPNGSGKTTLIRHMNGLLTPDRGEIRLFGNNIFKNLVLTRKTIGMVFQDADTQILGETVFDEVAFGPENLGMDRKTITQKVLAVLKDFGLVRFRHRHPASLSGGEKRRLTIASILVMDPEVIIFDEPFANLDYPASQDLVRIITGLHASGKTIVMATHDLDLVLGHADRMLIMTKGRIAALDRASHLAPRISRFGLKPLCTCSREGCHAPLI